MLILILSFTRSTTAKSQLSLTNLDLAESIFTGRRSYPVYSTSDLLLRKVGIQFMSPQEASVMTKVRDIVVL